MNSTQIQLINFLSAAIKGERIEVDSMEKINWKSIIEEAEAHNVKGLLYLAIYKSKYIKYIEKESLEKLKRDTFLTAVYQMEHIKQISNVLNMFNEEKVPVIVLKGLVIRDLYPKPELRTMGDADILVHKKDLNKVKKLLLELGYIEKESSKSHPFHAVFEHSKYPSIEVHRALGNKNRFKGEPIFENGIWQRAIKVKVGNSEALSLSFEDLAVHLCNHMARHSIRSGFGIRQLCDLVLLVEKKGDLIDWSSFINKIRAGRIEKFAMSIFSICRKLFNMTIPQELNSLELDDKERLDLLINDIFSSGVHGRRSLLKSFSCQLACKSQNINSNNYLGTFKRFRMLLFPSIDELSDRYAYAKKHNILMPIAWNHRFLCEIFNKEHSFYDKIKVLVAAAYISKKRNKLLKWLELI